MQEYVNSTMTTPAPTTTPAPGPVPSSTPAPAPATTTESSCQRQMDELASERDTYRGATIGMSVVAGIGAILLVAAVFMARSRRRVSGDGMVMTEKPHA